MYNFDTAAKFFKISFESILSKGLTCAYISYYVLKEMGWTSLTVRKKYMLASIIQDAFLKDEALSKLKSLTDPEVANLSEDELINFTEHPEKIANIARQLTQYPDLDFLLTQHHELPGRNGFPNRPTPSELQLAVCVFNITSNFARDFDGSEFKKSNYQKIMRVYQTEFNVGSFKDPLIALKKTLGVV